MAASADPCVREKVLAEAPVSRGQLKGFERACKRAKVREPVAERQRAAAEAAASEPDPELNEKDG